MLKPHRDQTTVVVDMKRECPDDANVVPDTRRRTRGTSCHEPPSCKPEDHGLTSEQSRLLSSRLQCDHKDVVAETLGYILNCRSSRDCQILREDVVEIWDSLHDCHKTREASNPKARFVVLGANPRLPHSVTNATTQLQQCTRALCAFIKQQQPEYSFTTLSLRLNCDKPPHRDTRNGFGCSFFWNRLRVGAFGLPNLREPSSGKSTDRELLEPTWIASANRFCLMPGVNYMLPRLG